MSMVINDVCKTASSGRAHEALRGMLYLLSQMRPVQHYLPVFSLIELSLTTEVQTITHSGHSVLVNPDYFLAQTPERRLYWLLHCAGHLCLRHVSAYYPFLRELQEKGKTEDALALAHAMDIVVDAMILEDQSFMEAALAQNMSMRIQSISIPDVRLKRVERFSKEPGGPSVQKAYLTLRKEYEGALGSVPPDDENHAPLPPELLEALQSLVDDQEVEETASRFETQRLVGQGSLGNPRAIHSARVNPIKWHDVLRQCWKRRHAELSTTKRTWARPQRRALAAGVYRPGPLPKPSIGPLVLVVDTSCSRNTEELSRDLAHIESMLVEAPPEYVILLFVDAAVCGVVRVEPRDYKNIRSVYRPVGGGGTDMPVALQWVRDNLKGVNIAGMMIYTDGYTPWPERLDHYPVWWLINTRVTAPAAAGVTIHVN